MCCDLSGPRCPPDMLTPRPPTSGWEYGLKDNHRQMKDDGILLIKTTRKKAPKWPNQAKLEGEQERLSFCKRSGMSK